MLIQYYLSQQNKQWTQNARMRFCVLLIFMLFLAFSTSALASIRKELHFEWDYDITLPELAGYIIYQDGQHLVTINSPTTLTLAYNVELETGQTTVVTMQAFDVHGNKSALSSKYSLDVPANVLPQPSLNLSTSSGEAQLVVDFDAEGSTDSDGIIISYLWDFGDGASATTVNANHIYATAGIYTVTLTVTDNDGGVATALTTVTVSPATPNTPPTALFYPTLTSGTAPLLVSFDGGHSTDDDGSIISYSWNFGDGSSAIGPTSPHLFTTSGAFTVELTVTDDKGSQATYSEVITVAAATKDPGTPVATFSVNPQVPIVNEIIHFSGAASTAPDGSITRYLWDFGDGKSSTGVATSHQYNVPGTYTVKMTVWDSYGTSSQNSTALTVVTLETRTLELRLKGAQNAILLLLLNTDK